MISATSKNHSYLPWYRLAEEALGNLIPQLSVDEINKLTPERSDWFPIPLASEVDIEDVKNRPDPHIDFKLSDDNGTIRIGMRCNTVVSVEKMKNILDSHQSKEKLELVSEMKKLDDDFRTQVLTKIKETNFAHVDNYTVEFEMASNQIDESNIVQIFDRIEAIRARGKRRMEEEKLRLNPETPVIDITFATIKQDPVAFKEKLLQMKRIYEICLSVKTSPELRRERRSMNRSKKWVESITKFECSKCGREYPADSIIGLKFCDLDGMRIVPVRESRTA